MDDSKENPKKEHKKILHQNATDEKGPLKDDHYNQYGKKEDDHKERASKKPE